jgi:hypothetical protein
MHGLDLQDDSSPKAYPADPVMQERRSLGMGISHACSISFILLSDDDTD